MLCAQGAEALSAPAVNTGEAYDLTTTSATLQGSIYPGNQQTTYSFQYGLTSSYGLQTPSMTASGNQDVHAVAPLADLAVDTTYYYRLVASNASGTVNGPQREFTTRKIPLTFTLAASPARDLFGTPFTVTGTLAGTGSANHPVVLEASPFPYIGGFAAVSAPQLTSPTGGFSFSVPPLTRSSELRVATLETPPAYSSVIAEPVPVRVTLNLRPTSRPGFVRLYGTVTPGEFGAIVFFQMMRPGQRPLGLGSTVIVDPSKAVSRFSRVLRIRHAGLYRASVYVGNGAQASNHSRALLIR
jgi:hypothetical protein